MNNEETGPQDTQETNLIHSLIPLTDFKAILGFDDREDPMKLPLIYWRSGSGCTPKC
jgi:hypothetical protein